jgi:hypothetical protein
MNARSPLLLTVSALALMIASSPPSRAADETTVTVVERPDATGRYDHYIANRAPLVPSFAVKLPVGAVRPTGWLKRQLELQAEGFHGHLAEISAFLKKENNAWLSKTGTGDHGWEEPPYWLKGFIGNACLLENERMLKEAQLWIDGALNSQQADGWFGPDKGRTGAATDLTGRDDLWPNMIMLFCLQTYYERTADLRVPELMKKYFRYLSTLPDEKFLVGYWPSMRGGDQLYSIFWLYNLTGESWLLDLARKTHRRTARWDTVTDIPGKEIANWHNVNIAQAFREPTLYWMLSKDPANLAGADRNWRKVRELYGQVPGGMYGADENARPGYNGPRQAIETCGIAEEMLSDELLIAATGDPLWAERCENAGFNSYPASMTADLKALRYLTAPNQPQSDHGNKAAAVQNSGPMFHFNPHDHRCCQHNTGHAWPYFTQHLWYAAPGNGLAAYLYGPCEVKAKVGDGVEARIVETTRYPFEEQVELALSLPKSAKFPLYLRIPAWCENAKLSVNGKATKTGLVAGKLARVDREWKNGDKVVLALPMEVALTTWTANRGTVSVNRGPLTYSLAIQEDVKRFGGTDAWPAWDIFPGSSWNYGLVLKAGAPKGLKVMKAAWPADHQPFRPDSAPIRLQATAIRIPNWTLDPRGCINEVIQSPVKSGEREETVTLIPMGAARLRLSAFPVIGTGPDAKEWPASPKPAHQASASHCNDGDTVDALSDGRLPQKSSDGAIPRFTWWDHRGTAEWVQYDFDKPRKISAAAVYWFDDTGAGQCRVPKLWKLVYRVGDTWKPVEAPAGFGTTVDSWNRVTFPAVQTAALRIEVQLQPEFSGGILEWRIGE